MARKVTANSGKKHTGKVENLKPWPKGVSGNPAGAPKRGESWAETIQRIGEMTDAEFVKLKHANPTQKQQAIMAIYMALKNDPQPGVFNAIMDRTEGKVKDQVELTGANGGPLEMMDVKDRILSKLNKVDASPAPDSVSGIAGAG